MTGHRRASGRRREALAAIIWLAAISACSSGPPRSPAAGPGTSPAARVVPDAAVADWGGIPVAPLGTELAALYSGLHEILYFQSAPGGGSSPDPGAAVAADCYRSNGPAPRVLDREVEDYVLCFSHDRLARVEAVMRLPAKDARTLERRACDAWLPASVATTRSEGDCGGRRGDAAFRLHRDALESDTGTTVSIVVYTPGGAE